MSSALRDSSCSLWRAKFLRPDLHRLWPQHGLCHPTVDLHKLLNIHDGTLMRIEGSKEFRIYSEDVEEFPIHVVTPGLQRALQEAYHRRMEEVRDSSAAREIGTESRENGGVRRDMILRNLQANALERQFLERTLM